MQKKSHKVKTELEDRVTELYQESDGSIPDMKHIDRKNGGAGFFIIFLVCLFLGAAGGAAWLGYFLFNPSHGTFSEAQIVATVSTPDHIDAGVENEYDIRIQNTSARDIASAEVSIHGPDGFIITTADPVALTTKNERWALGAIPSNGEKIVHLKGMYVGATGASGVLHTIVSYMPSNFNATFEKVIDSPLTVATDAISLKTQTTQTAAGTTYLITYANSGIEPVLNTQLTADVGSNVVITKTTPATQISGSVVTLIIPEIQATSTNTLVIVTTPKTGVAPEPYAIPQTVSLSSVINGVTLPFAQATLSGATTAGTTQAGAGLTLSTQIQNQNALQAESVIPLTLQYTNATGASVKNATWVVTIDAPSVNNKSIFDFSDIQTTGDPMIIGKQISPDRRTATITWTTKDVPELTEIAPGTHIAVLFTLRVKSAATFTPFPTGSTATLNAALTADGVHETATPVLFNFAATN